MIKPFLALALMLPITTSFATPLMYGKFTYEVLNGTEIEITGYPTTEVGEVTIPDEIDNKPVVLIEFHAFLDCVGITRIIVPDSVRSIDIWAFQGCSSLSEISVGAGNTNLSSVDGVLFDKTQTNLINCPEGKTGTYVIPGTVTSIGWSAFDRCSKLTSVTIPSGVTSIGNTAFRGCSDLTSLTIPNSVTDIGWSAFDSCSDLASVTLPNNITSIRTGMFAACTSLNSINIPNSVTDIGGFAFSGCSDLTSIAIPSGVTSIGTRAFGFCNQLTTINIPNGITSIAQGLFTGCNNLASVNIPNGVTSIGDRAFNSTGLASVTLPGGLTSIGEDAFGSTRLISVTIPDSVTSIGDRAFNACFVLTAITVDGANTHYSSSDGALFNKNQTTLIQYPAGKSGVYSIPDGVTSIGDSAFFGNILTNVYIPNSITSIGRLAFSSMRNTNLNTITIPKNVISIGDQAFAFSRFLVTTYFAGNAPATFGVNVFDGVSASHQIFYRNDATGFTSPAWNGYTATEIKFGYVVLGNGTIEITSYPTTETGPVIIPFSIEQKIVTSIRSNAFFGCRDITSITIPDGLSNIALGAFDDCESLLFFSASGGNAHYFTPDGVLLNRDQTTLIRYPLAKTGGYMIPNSVTSLSDGAFKNCYGLTYVTIPSSVTSIGSRVFCGCGNLTETHFEGNAPASFGTHVFASVAANHRIYYTNTATGFTSPTWNGYISEKFEYSYIVVGGTTITITDYPTTVTGDIVIPGFIEGKPVTSIGNNAFNGCGSLTSVGIPDSVTNIGNWAFLDCTNLTSVRIPQNTMILGDGAFFGCTGLTYIIIPRNVSSLGSFAFEGCSNLAATYFAGNAPLDGINMFESVAPGHTIYYLDTSTGFSGSWSLLSSQTINTTTYPAASWLLNHYIIYDTPLSQDLNGDGVSLLMAYALNLNPHERLTNQLPKVVVSSTKLELTHYSGSAGLTYHVETSKNLEDWAETGITTTAPDINGMVTASMDRDGDCGFLRLVVREN